jgi:hypothetical protein
LHGLAVQTQVLHVLAGHRASQPASRNSCRQRAPAGLGREHNTKAHSAGSGAAAQQIGAGAARVHQSQLGTASLGCAGSFRLSCLPSASIGRESSLATAKTEQLDHIAVTVKPRRVGVLSFEVPASGSGLRGCH